MSENANGSEPERPREADLGAWDEGIVLGEQRELDEIPVFATAGHILSMLQRCEAGESADLVFAELWANAQHIF